MRRVTFNLNMFVTDLHNCYEHEKYDLIDDVVQTYKDFIRRADDDIIDKSKEYLMNHELVKEGDIIKSYIIACHKNRV